MALPTLEQIKDRLKVETGAIEDADLTIMRTSALGSLEAFVGRPIDARSLAMIVELPYPSWDGVCPVYQLMLPKYPVKITNPVPTIVDMNGDAITEFRVNPNTGLVTFTTPVTTFPLTITATVGLSLLESFATAVEPTLAQGLIDLCADWYLRRNPNAATEADGGGLSTNWQALGVPDRICKLVQRWRLVRAN